MTTEERIEKLEAELAAAKRLIRRLMAGAGVVLVIFALFVAVRAMMGVTHSQVGGDIAKVIRASRFEVVDDQGRPRAGLIVLKDGPRLDMFDEKGTSRAMLITTETGAGLTLFDEKGIGRAMLSTSNGGPGLVLFDEKGKVRAGLGVNETTTPDGKVTKYPESSLLLFGPDGNIIWRAP